MRMDAAIELTGGDWDGLVYQYGKVQFEEGKPNINFDKNYKKVTNDGLEDTEDWT